MDFAGAAPDSGDPTRPLLLLLHGFGADEHDLLGVLPALPSRFDAVSLRGPLDAGNGGAAWTELRTSGSPVDPVQARAAATSILDWIDARATVRSIVPLGFSQGGLMVTELLRARPDRFAAGVVLSGFHADGDRTGDARLAARRPPVFFGWGTVDPLIPEALFASTARWLSSRTALTEHSYPGLAHQISASELADVSAFLDSAVPSGLDP